MLITDEQYKLLLQKLMSSNVGLHEIIENLEIILQGNYKKCW